MHMQYFITLCIAYHKCIRLFNISALMVFLCGCLEILMSRNTDFARLSARLSRANSDRFRRASECSLFSIYFAQNLTKNV